MMRTSPFHRLVQIIFVGSVVNLNVGLFLRRVSLTVLAEDVPDGGNATAESVKDYLQSFRQMAVMPLECISFNGTDFIKFHFYEEGSRQCLGNHLSTYIISIAHYMHAYFNQQALELGDSFVLPWDAGFLNCVELPGSSSQTLYAKIGCEDRKTVSSTKFVLRMYKDQSCSVPFNERFKSSFQGKYINGYWMSTSVSFSPNFRKCQRCFPTQVASSFTRGNYWYDDDFINFQDQNRHAADGGDETYGNYSYFQSNDDNNQYFTENSRTNSYYRRPTQPPADNSNWSLMKYYWRQYIRSHRSNAPTKSPTSAPTTRAPTKVPTPVPVTIAPTLAPVTTQAPGAQSSSSRRYWWKYWGTPTDPPVSTVPSPAPAPTQSTNWWHFWSTKKKMTLQAANGQNRMLKEPFLQSAELEMYHERFWKNFFFQRDSERSSNKQTNVTWNFCERLYNHSYQCDKACLKAVDHFVNQHLWSAADLGILTVLCTFISAMMIIILVKRAKSFKRALIYEDEQDTPHPGLPPVAILMLFVVLASVISSLVYLKLVTQTLALLVFLCIVLFIILLKFTLLGEMHYREPQLHYASMSKRVLD